MMTRRDSDSERWIYGFSLDERIPSEHLLRKIKGAIDFDFIYKLVSEHYSHTGAPSVDPVIVFKLSLIGYLYNIPSERKLLEDASLNLAYLWFLGYDIDEELPDHSIMTKARVRFGPDVYRDFFHRVVKVCIDAGLVEGNTAFLDSTLIDAQGKPRDMRSKALLKQLDYAANGFVDKLFEGEQVEENRGPALPKRTNDRLRHPKDPDADIVKRDDKPAGFCYKGHFAVDGSSHRIITSVVATGGAAADEHYLLPLLSEYEELIGRPNHVVADQKYGSSINFRILKAKGISPAIRPNNLTGKKTPGFPKNKFFWDKTNDVFICPNKKVLAKAQKLGNYQPYRSKQADCKMCSLKPLCIPTSKIRTVIRTGHETILFWASSMLSRPESIELLKKRQVWPETVFAHGKMYHGLDKARFRRRWKVEIQLLITAAAMNLEKLARSKPKRNLTLGLGPVFRSKLLFAAAQIVY